MQGIYDAFYSSLFVPTKLIRVLKGLPGGDAPARANTEVASVVRHHAVVAAQLAPASPALGVSTKERELTEASAVVQQLRPSAGVPSAPFGPEASEVATSWARPSVAPATAKALEPLAKTRGLGSPALTPGAPIDTVEGRLPTFAVPVGPTVTEQVP